MPLRIVQSNEKRETEERWDWEVHLEGDPGDLDQIEYVEYSLHESFPNPIRRKYDRSSGFKLETSGWGTFPLYLSIHYKDQKRRDEQQVLPLRFDQSSTHLEVR
jgi:transcription initiation factor IIF auxiliary subunit